MYFFTSKNFECKPLHYTFAMWLTNNVNRRQDTASFKIRFTLYIIIDFINQLNTKT